MRLDHIQLAMPIGGENLARSFFGEILEMTEELKPYPLSERSGAWFRAGNCIIHLGTESGFQPQKKAHPAFLIEDLDHLASKLKSRHFEVNWDHALPERRRFYSTDPFGNRIEFMEDGHGFTQT